LHISSGQIELLESNYKKKNSYARELHQKTKSIKILFFLIFYASHSPSSILKNTQLSLIHSFIDNSNFYISKKMFFELIHFFFLIE